MLKKNIPSEDTSVLLSLGGSAFIDSLLSCLINSAQTEVFLQVLIFFAEENKLAEKIKMTK
jgi:hypothetical protein